MERTCGKLTASRVQAAAPRLVLRSRVCICLILLQVADWLPLLLGYAKERGEQQVTDCTNPIFNPRERRTSFPVSVQAEEEFELTHPRPSAPQTGVVYQYSGLHNNNGGMMGNGQSPRGGKVPFTERGGTLGC